MMIEVSQNERQVYSFFRLFYPQDKEKDRKKNEKKK